MRCTSERSRKSLKPGLNRSTRQVAIMASLVYDAANQGKGVTAYKYRNYNINNVV